MEHCEQNGITQVQNLILPNVITGDHVVTDLKLSSLFISAVQIFRICRKTTIVMRVLTGVIRIFVLHCNSNDKNLMLNNCINAVVYCCLVASSSSPHFKQLVVNSFRAAFEKEIFSRSRGVFKLCTMVVKSKNALKGNLDARRFLKLEIVPLLEEFVQKVEYRRGIGFDKSLRYFD